MKLAVGLFVAASCMAGFASVAQAESKMMTDKELMADLRGAAPANIVAHATVLNMGADGKMKPIQQGTNGWTCMDPGGEPMCADGGAMEWVAAWQAHGPAPQKLGFVYMLKGDHGASNTDPYATGKTADNYWIQTGPHVMIMGGDAKAMLESYPHEPKGDPKHPYVMWPGTPYQHLMLPVK